MEVTCHASYTKCDATHGYIDHIDFSFVSPLRALITVFYATPIFQCKSMRKEPADKDLQLFMSSRRALRVCTPLYPYRNPGQSGRNVYRDYSTPHIPLIARSSCLARLKSILVVHLPCSCPKVPRLPSRWCSCKDRVHCSKHVETGSKMVSRLDNEDGFQRTYR